MKLEDFNNLDPKNIGNWPIPVKGVIIILLCAAALFAGYWFDTQNQLIRLTQVQEQEEKLKTEFEQKQWKAATLPKLKEQLAQIETTLGELLKKLPDKAQVDELIRDISQTVLANGLKQELFEPQYKQEKSEKGIYTQLPIKLRARGDYHSFGKFISGIASMNRIVTIHDVSIAPATGGPTSASDKATLTMELMAQIYRYVENAEEPAKPGAAKPGAPPPPPKK